MMVFRTNWAALDAERAANAALKEENERLRNAIVWALGAGKEFKPQGTKDGKYWWRGELETRAGLEWDGEKYISVPNDKA